MMSGNATTSAGGAASAVALDSPQGPHSQLARHRRVASATLTALIPLVIWFAPLGMDRKVQGVLAITSFLIIAWMTQVLDHTLTGLIGCYLYWALGLVTFGA